MALGLESKRGGVCVEMNERRLEKQAGTQWVGPGSTGQPLRGSCDLNLSPTLLRVNCFLACRFLFSPNIVCKKKKKIFQ